MPLPTKQITETRDEFIQRCMRDTIMRKEYPDVRQRLAVCGQQVTN